MKVRMTWKSDIETVRDFVTAALRTFEWLETIPRTNMQADIIGLRDVVLPRLRLISDRIEELEAKVYAMNTMALSTGHYTADQGGLVAQLQAAQEGWAGTLERNQELRAETERLRGELRRVGDHRPVSLEGRGDGTGSKFAVTYLCDGDEPDGQQPDVIARAALTPEGTQDE